MADRFRGLLRRPFAEQVAAFRLRLERLVPTARWDDISGPQHDRAFMVAGAMKADLLADLAASVDRAISEGTGIEQFRRDFRAIVRKHGWHGWTGEGTEKGEAWRTRVIYRTNMNTTYMAGRRAQLMDPAFKFWIYRHSGALEPRLQHLSWDRLVLPRDHPFWQKHFPPNGWGCGCRVFGAFSLDHARRRGGDPDKALPDNWNDIDPRTGTPPGIQRGWDHAPGATTADTIRALTEKTIDWPTRIAKAFMEDLPEGARDEFVRAYRDSPGLREAVIRYAKRAEEAGVDAVPRRRTFGLLTSDDLAWLSEAGIDARGFDVTMDANAVRHILGKHGPAFARAGEIPVTPESFGLIGPALNHKRVLATSAGPGSLGEGEAIWSIQSGGRITVLARFPAGRLLIVFEPRTGRRELALVSLYWVGS